MKAKNITADTVRTYVASRKQEKTHYGKVPANATINRDLSALKRMFNLAIQARKLDRVPHIEKLKENNVRRGFFNHHEYLQLREELPEYLRPVVALAYHTGMRKGEILSLRWLQINFADRTVRLEAGTTKNDEPRVIPLVPDRFDEILRQQKLRNERFPELSFCLFQLRQGRSDPRFPPRVGGSDSKVWAAGKSLPRFSPYWGAKPGARRRSRGSCNGDLWSQDAQRV